MSVRICIDVTPGLFIVLPEFMDAILDVPPAGSLCDPLCFRVEGWFDNIASPVAIDGVEIWLGDRCVGRTEHIFVRSDVNAVKGWPANHRSGFAVTGYAPDAGFGSAGELSVRIRTRAGVTEVRRQPVRFIACDHRTVDHGQLLAADSLRPWRRDEIFGWGQSQDGGSPDVLAYLHRYLNPPPCRVVDVGCGLGWYGRQLLPKGFAWHGVELKESDCAFLASRGLPHTHASGGALPFADGSFDAALLIEVLEHIAEPKPFLAEVQRVAPQRLLVSVPNCELVTYLRPHLAVPWHMLEADHKNFFTRWNLAALLREFYPRVEVIGHSLHPCATVEGSPLYYNLFAIASR